MWGMERVRSSFWVVVGGEGIVWVGAGGSPFVIEMAVRECQRCRMCIESSVKDIYIGVGNN